MSINILDTIIEFKHIEVAERKKAISVHTLEAMPLFEQKPASLKKISIGQKNKLAN